MSSASASGDLLSVKILMDMWRLGETQDFLKMSPQYAHDCSGEGHMRDTAMLFGPPGWKDYSAAGEFITEHFPSSGSGQCNVVFPVS